MFLNNNIGPFFVVTFLCQPVYEPTAQYFQVGNSTVVNGCIKDHTSYPQVFPALPLKIIE